MQKYIAIFEVPDDYTPAEFIDSADGWFRDAEGVLLKVGSKLTEVSEEVN